MSMTTKKQSIFGDSLKLELEAKARKDAEDIEATVVPNTPEAPDSSDAPEVKEKSINKKNKTEEILKPEKGRGDKINKESDKVFKYTKKRGSRTKCVYLSEDNTAYIQRFADIYGLSFSEILNQLIEQFRTSHTD